MLNNIKTEIGSNMPFVEKQFHQCINKGIEDAKRNIEGHVLNVALSSAKRGLVRDDEVEQITLSGCKLIQTSNF